MKNRLNDKKALAMRVKLHRWLALYLRFNHHVIGVSGSFLVICYLDRWFVG